MKFILLARISERSGRSTKSIIKSVVILFGEWDYSIVAIPGRSDAI
jgi:hypothetical protein